MAIRPQAILCLMAMLGSGQSACTRLDVFTDGEVRTRSFLGYASIELPPSENPVFVRTNGAGVVAGQRHLTIGWMNEELALFPDPTRCAVLIVAATPDDVTAIERILSASGQRLDRICIAGKGQNDAQR